MQKFSHNKRRAMSIIFNLGIFVFLVVALLVLLWQLPTRSTPPRQPQTAGQVVPAPTKLETPTVDLNGDIPITGSNIVTYIYTMPVPSMLGVVIDEQRAVVEIVPESAAEKAGVQLGDILERMDDIPLLLPDDRMKARFLMNRPPSAQGNGLRLTVIRDGVTVEVPFVPEAPFNPGILPDPPPPTITPVWPPYDFL